MSAITPVEKVSALLQEANYRRLTGELMIAGIAFDVPAAFVGTGKSSDLIVVFDTAFEPELRLQQKTTSIARALDILGSRRSLTTIITGPRPSSKASQIISRVSRILFVKDASNETALREACAVLLPLVLPTIRDETADVAAILGSLRKSDPLANELVEAARLNNEAVESRLVKAIEEPFLADTIQEDL